MEDNEVFSKINNKKNKNAFLRKVSITSLPVLDSMMSE